ncbi:MAG: hypothetical protein PWP49_501 [Thermococcaceae archaeon]|nr:hypothetical protein [Thermococcaceae archaeon]MDN5320081.1 hypothetical protein [Thermococcaceae archaeon]
MIARPPPLAVIKPPTSLRANTVSSMSRIIKIEKVYSFTIIGFLCSNGVSFITSPLYIFILSYLHYYELELL